jgi:serralysin
LDFSKVTTAIGWGFIDGGSGNDKITGSKFDEKLFGKAGSDTLIGGDGIDTLTGGTGKDLLTGGLKKDIFDFNLTNESVKGPNRDQILDFKRSQGDKIDLSTIDAGTSANPGNDKLKFIGTAAFSGTGGLSGKVLQIDVNGGAADMEINILTTAIKTGDFIL